jgi:hypothetical protein
MLVVNFKRFMYDNCGRLSRLSKHVRFPLRLEIGDYMSRANRGKPLPYILVAVLVHRGRSCDCGHYFAYVKKGIDWYLANDAEVTKVDVEEVLGSQAYVMVYEVAGMKENYNFDCYSRYHRSLDEIDEENETRGNRSTSPTWDFSASLASLIEACDATGLCGSLGNVVDGNSSGEPKQSITKKGTLSKQRAISDSGVDLKAMKQSNGNMVSQDPYYKRGRSHTPSRNNRIREPRQRNARSKERDNADMFDFEPPDGGVNRRAKSLSRVEKKDDEPKRAGQSSSKSSSSSSSSRHSYTNRPREHSPLEPSSMTPRQKLLPPLHEGKIRY